MANKLPKHIDHVPNERKAAEKMAEKRKLETPEQANNGKIDSRALPPPESSSEPSDKYVAPRTPIEDILVTVWSELVSSLEFALFYGKRTCVQ